MPSVLPAPELPVKPDSARFASSALVVGSSSMSSSDGLESMPAAFGLFTTDGFESIRLVSGLDSTPTRFGLERSAESAVELPMRPSNVELPYMPDVEGLPSRYSSAADCEGLETMMPSDGLLRRLVSAPL